jgi:hypothetical protein
MIAAAILFLLFSILTVRSILLMFAESKPFFNRFLDLLNALLFGIVAVLLSVFLHFRLLEDPLRSLLIFSGIALPVAASLNLRLGKPYRPRPLLLLIKTFFVLFILCLALLILMTSGFLFLAEDRPVAKIIMTGQVKPQLVEWKSPVGSLKNETLNSYEVRIERPSGKPVANLFVYGDQVAIKAKVIRFRPILHVIGMHNLCHIEYVYNGYSTAARHNAYPHLAQEISMNPPILENYQKVFWSYWEKSYFQQGKYWWLKSATVESQYFPVVDQNARPFKGAYYLTVTPGGLSGVPLP